MAVLIATERLPDSAWCISPGGGGYLVYLSDGDVPFFRVSFLQIFLEQGIKRRQIFWSRLSKHVKRGNFVTTGYYLVKFLCF